MEGNNAIKTSQPAWSVQNDNGSVNIVAIFDFIVNQFIEIFGIEHMNREMCLIHNDTTSDCPELSFSQPLSLRLAQPSTDYWAQTIYQMSHELCHYALRPPFKDNVLTYLSWFEEIICEAMSLYSLEKSAKNWKLCSLSAINPTFDNSILKYLKQECCKTGTDSFSKCNTVELLAEYNCQSLLHPDRDSHRNERNQVYEIISQDPHSLLAMKDYSNYIEHNGVTIDFDSWYANIPCQLIVELKNIQPVKQ